MTLASFLLQLLNGLSSASALFLVPPDLTLIFGVTRVVNFAHGSLYMLGAYCAYGLGELLARFAGPGALAFWGGVLLAALVVAAIGALVEALLLKRLYARAGIAATYRHLRRGADRPRCHARAVGAPKTCSARVRRVLPARSKSSAIAIPQYDFLLIAARSAGAGRADAG